MNGPRQTSKILNECEGHDLARQLAEAMEVYLARGRVVEEAMAHLAEAKERCDDLEMIRQRKLNGVEELARRGIPSVVKAYERDSLPRSGLAQDHKGTRSNARHRQRATRTIIISPIIKEYIEYREGRASLEAIARVEAAIRDANSELNRELVGVIRNPCVSEDQAEKPVRETEPHVDELNVLD